MPDNSLFPTALTDTGQGPSFDAFFAALPVAIAVIAPDRKEIVWTTRHCRHLFELGEDDDPAHITRELIQSDSKFQTVRDRLDAEGQVLGHEMVLLTGAGNMVVAVADFAPVQLGDDTYIAITLQDITDRKQAEADICHDAEADKLMSVVSGQLLGIDIQGAIADALKNFGIYLEVDRIAAAPVTGDDSHWRHAWWVRDKRVMTGKGFDEIPLMSTPWANDQLQAGRGVIVRQLADLPDEAELDHAVFKDNSIQSFAVTPIFYQGGMLGYVCMESRTSERDWTVRETELLNQFSNVIGSALVRKHVESRLRRAIKRNEDSLRALEGARNQLIDAEKMAALGDLVAGIAHETNTPLGSAVTTTSALKARTRQIMRAVEDGKVKRSDMNAFFEYAQEGFKILETNLNRAADLIQSFKRVAVDVSHASVQEINLRDYLEDILRSVQPRTKKFKKVSIGLDCPVDLDVDTEPGAFSQIVTNLIMNALLHGFDNELDAEGSIGIEVFRKDDLIHLNFSDSGKGMSPEVQEKLFDPYFTTKRGQGGSGLGMPIIRDLVTDTLKGRIVVDSSPGEGSRFHITFPAHLDSGPMPGDVADQGLPGQQGS